MPEERRSSFSEFTSTNNDVVREKRQILVGLNQSKPKQSNFKGQTQTQFISFDNGEKSEKSGIAEATAKQDQSRATVRKLKPFSLLNYLWGTGQSVCMLIRKFVILCGRIEGRMGMGQAQSQSASEDPCAECAANNHLVSATRFEQSFDSTKSPSGTPFIEAGTIPNTNSANAPNAVNPFSRHSAQPSQYFTPRSAGNPPTTGAFPTSFGPRAQGEFSNPGAVQGQVESRTNLRSGGGATPHTAPLAYEVTPTTIPLNSPTIREQGGQYFPNFGVVGAHKPAQNGANLYGIGESVESLGPSNRPIGVNVYPNQDSRYAQEVQQAPGLPPTAQVAFNRPQVADQRPPQVGGVSNYRSRQPTLQFAPSGVVSPYSQQTATSLGNRPNGLGSQIGMYAARNGGVFNTPAQFSWSPATSFIHSQPTGGGQTFGSVHGQYETESPYIGGAANAGSPFSTSTSQSGTRNYPQQQEIQTPYSDVIYSGVPGVSAWNAEGTYPPQGIEIPQTDAHTYFGPGIPTSPSATGTYPSHTIQTPRVGNLGYPVPGIYSQQPYVGNVVSIGSEVPALHGITAASLQPNARTRPDSVTTYPQQQVPTSFDGNGYYAQREVKQPTRAGYEVSSPQQAHDFRPGLAVGAENAYFPQTNTFMPQPQSVNPPNVYDQTAVGGTPFYSGTNYDPTLPRNAGFQPIGASSYPPSGTRYYPNSNVSNQGAQQPAPDAVGHIQGGGKGMDVSQGSQITAIDTLGGESQSSSSIDIGANNDTKATASAQGKTRNGRAQTQVSGTYSSSFSAHAQTSDNEKNVESQIFGNSTGAVSSSQGKAGKSLSQSQIRYSYDTGASVAEAQSSGMNYDINTQIQAGNKGGIADAQSSGPGSTSSQAQIGFLPLVTKKEQASVFEGGGSSSAQSGTFSGLSQTQLHGSFKLGSSFAGSAQSSAGQSQNTNATRLAFNSTNLSLLTANEDLKQETNHPPSDAESTNATEKSINVDIRKFAEKKTDNTVIKSTVPLSSLFQNDHVNKGEGEDNGMLTFAQNDRQNTDKTITLNKNSPNIKTEFTLSAGQIVPGTLEYRVPNGFRGKIATSTTADETPTVATTSRLAQTRTVVVRRSSNDYNKFKKQDIPSDVLHANANFIDDKDEIYSHIYTTSSTTCGHFIFTCNLIDGSKGRTKICKPGPSTYADGTPC